MWSVWWWNMRTTSTASAWCCCGAQVRKKALKQGVQLQFFSRRDHLDRSLVDYKVHPPGTVLHCGLATAVWPQ